VNKGQGEEGVVAGCFGVVLAVVLLGEKPNVDPLYLIKLCESKRVFGWGLVGVIPEVNLAHVLSASDCAVSVRHCFRAS
jgi:hypothetical protein